MGYPQPATKPWPPVLLGRGGTDRAFRRMVAYGDGWLPAFASESGLEQGPGQIEQGRRRLDQLAREGGRDPSTLQITAILRGPQVGGDLSPGRLVDRTLLRRFEAAGTDRAAVSLPMLTSEQDAREALERIAERVL